MREREREKKKGERICNMHTVHMTNCSGKKMSWQNSAENLGVLKICV